MPRSKVERAAPALAGSDSLEFGLLAAGAVSTKKPISAERKPSLGSDHFTTGHPPELERCIKRTSAGQASWAGWRAPEGKTCGSCRSFEKEGRRSLLSEPLGRCSKFCALTGKKGPKFSAHCVACRFFGDGSP